MQTKVKKLQRVMFRHLWDERQTHSFGLKHCYVQHLIDSFRQYNVFLNQHKIVIDYVPKDALHGFI